MNLLVHVHIVNVDREQEAGGIITPSTLLHASGVRVESQESRVKSRRPKKKEVVAVVVAGSSSSNSSGNR